MVFETGYQAEEVLFSVTGMLVDSVGYTTEVVLKAEVVAMDEVG